MWEINAIEERADSFTPKNKNKLAKHKSETINDWLTDPLTDRGGILVRLVMHQIQQEKKSNSMLQLFSMHIWY